jgi:hypothetical protein
MLPPSERHEIERLRGFRVRRGREAALGEPVEALAAELKKQRRKVGGAAGAWAAVLPRALVEQTAIVGLRGGVLTVRVADASSRFQIDGVLRAGGERSLARVSDGAIRRVRLVL